MNRLCYRQIQVDPTIPGKSDTRQYLKNRGRNKWVSF